MTQSETTSAAGGPLWCMHIQGPDDLHAAPDFWTALAWAAELNSLIAEKAAKGNWKSDDNYPLSQAVVRQWTGTPESHAVRCEIELADRAEHEAKRKAAALAAPTAKGGTEVPADPLVAYLERQWAWSKETFGPALRTKGIVQHITKELREIEADPHDLAEWVDVIILAMDGFWRHGGKPSDLLPAMQAKQDRNFARTWPDWRSVGEDQAIEHDRSGEASPPPLAGAAGGGSGDLEALSAGATPEIKATQITLGEGLVDIGPITHEGRVGVLFRPRAEHIPFGQAGELQECAYWPGPNDVVLWVSGEGPQVAIDALAALAPTPDLGAQGEPVAWLRDLSDELDRLGEEAGDREASANAEERQNDADFCAGEANAYHEAARVLFEACEHNAPTPDLTARGESVGDDILRAAVNVRRDGSTSCQLRFGDKVKFSQGRSAVNQAIGALVTELQDSSACPASRARATSDTQGSIRLLGMIEDGDLETPRQTLFAEWSNADCAAQCRMQARANLDPELSAFWIEVSRRLIPAPDIGAQDELQINQRDILFDALWRLSARLDIIDPKVTCGIPELLTAVEARIALASVHGEASDLVAQGEAAAEAIAALRAIKAIGLRNRLKAPQPEADWKNAVVQMEREAEAALSDFEAPTGDLGAATETEREPNAAVTVEIERGLARCSDPVRYAIRKEASDLIGLHAPGNRHLEQAVIAALLRRTAQSQKGTAR